MPVSDERDRPAVDPEPRVERETTVIHTGGDGGGSGGGMIALVILLLVVAVGAFLFFGGYLERAADKTELNVNVEAPDIKMPDIDIDVGKDESQPADTPANSN